MERITLESQAELIERWKSQTGTTGRGYVPANIGISRTPAKRALLQALSDIAEEQGTPTRFAARF